MSPKRLDETIKKDVVDQLYWDNRINAANVEVNVKDGVVSLNGNVPSYSSRLSATKDARAIKGVSHVFNHLLVENSAVAKGVGDIELENRAKQALYWNCEIDSSNIEVQVHDGIATLKGSVDLYWQKWEAEDSITSISGIKGIENHLTIVPTESFEDKDIARNIEKALERNYYTDAENIIVKVEDGAVTLTGFVPNWFVLSQAEDAATYTAGVVDVINKLEISTST